MGRKLGVATRTAALVCLTSVIVVLNAARAMANDVPQSFTLDGRLFSDSAATTPLIDASITFKVQILDEAQVCVLYEEQQTVNTLSSKGYFSVQVGTNTGDIRRTVGDVGNAMATVFQNLSVVNGKLLSNGAACTAGPLPGKRRFARVVISPATMGGAPRTLAPDISIDSVPNAVVAERAESLQGLRGTDFIKVNSSSGNVLTQANIESVFSSLARFNSLTAVVNGTSTDYMRSNSASGAQLPVISGAPTSPAPGSIWYDTTDSKLKYQTGGGPVPLGTGGGSVSSVDLAVPTELSVSGGPVTTSGTLTVAWANQTTNKVFAAPNGTTGAPTFRALLPADIPSLPYIGNLGGTPSMQSGLNGSKGGATTAGRIWISTDTKEIYRDNGATWDLLGSASASPTGAAAGDLSGTYPNPGVAKIQGVAVSATTPLDGQVLKYVSATPAWTASNFSIGDLKTAGGAQQFAGSASCAATQTLTWSSLTNTFACTTIAGLDAGVITTGTIAAGRLPASAAAWTVAGSDVYRSGGLVGIGTSSPTNVLSVVGNDTGNPIFTSVNNGSTMYLPVFETNGPNITSGQSAYFAFGKQRASNDQASIGFYYSGVGSTSNRMDFTFYGGSPVISALASGRVGIGTQSPGALLDVVGGDAMINGARVGIGAGNVTSNTALGLSALNANTTGGWNTAVGWEALSANTTGTYHTAIGQGALRLNNAGLPNISIGSGSMYNNTTGDRNTVVGTYSMINSTGGSNNATLGHRALQNLLTGSQNTALGSKTMQNATSAASDNTALGFQSLNGVTTGNNNIAIGSNAGGSVSSGNNNIAIGADVGVGTADNQLNIGNTIYGDTATGKVGIGTSTLSSKLTVAGQIETTSGGIKFPNGTVQTTAASGSIHLAIVSNPFDNSGGAGLTLTAGSFNPATFTTVDSDAEGNWDVANNYYVVPETAIYRVVTKMRVQDDIGAVYSFGQGAGIAAVDNADFGWFGTLTGAAGGYNRNGSLNERTMNLTAGDHVIMYYYADGFTGRAQLSMTIYKLN